MSTVKISKKFRTRLKDMHTKQKSLGLVPAYLSFLEESLSIQPILFVKEKRIYQGSDELIASLESRDALWRESEISINLGEADVNAETKKIYVCPYTGKVFANNTHSNPQDAIYDWVSNLPESRAKGQQKNRFLVSDDPSVIANYYTHKHRSFKKILFSSLISGKLFGSKDAIREELLKKYSKSFPLHETLDQNRFQIEDTFLEFLQEKLDEDQLLPFVEALSAFDEFSELVAQWVDSEEDET